MDLILFMLLMFMFAPVRKDNNMITMEEAKQTLLERINEKAKCATTSELKELADAYAALRRDEILERMSHGQGMFGGFGKPAETEGETT